MLPRSAQRSGPFPQNIRQEPQQPKSAWEYYLDMTRIEDAEREREVTEQVDTQLVFAGLFAAFLSAFLIETLRRLQEDSTATLLDVMIYQTQMMRNDSLPPYHREPFTPAPRLVAVNALFFASLALILIVAFISILVKGWIREVDSGLAAIARPRRRALVREYRCLGLERWKFLEIVHFLPALIYLSLLLFFCGLLLFIFDIEAGCGFVIAAIFALGVLFFMTTTTIAAFDDSAPFRSPLSYALGHQYRRLHSALLEGTTFWRRCLIISANSGYPRIIRALIYRLAKIARWKPFSEAAFRDKDSVPVWDEQDINISYAVINRLSKSLPGQGASREVFRSLVLAGDPAHMLRRRDAFRLLHGWAPKSDEMTPEAAHATGLLFCRTKCPTWVVQYYVFRALPVLTTSRKPWDQLLACVIQSQLSEDHDVAHFLQAAHAQVLQDTHIVDTPNRVLLIVRFLCFAVSRSAEPESKAAAVRILSALLLKLRLVPDLSKHEELVHSILRAFVIINDIKLADIFLHSPLSEFPSLPYLVYSPSLLSQIIDPTQWCTTIFVLPACREFARTLIEWLWRRSGYIQVDSRILHGLPLSRLEEYALDPPSDSFGNLILASLLLEAMISHSGNPRSDFPVLDKHYPDLEQVLALYDSYLIWCNAMPSLPMQNLLSPQHCMLSIHPHSTLGAHHPWLALHIYTLMRKDIPHELISALEWSDTPALNMIACDRLQLYDTTDVFPEPPLISLFLSSNTYETILGAFKWHLYLMAHPSDTISKPYGESVQNLDFKRSIEILFSSDADEHQTESSWILILDHVMPVWSWLPNELKQSFVSRFFDHHSIRRESIATNPNSCLGIAWLEHLWSTVLASLAGAVYIEEVAVDLVDLEDFDRNTGWDGNVKMELEEREEQQLERAQRNRLVCSVDEILSTLVTLLEMAHEAGTLVTTAVAHLQTSLLLSQPRLYHDTDSVQCIEGIIESYRPHLCPLPESTSQEAEMLTDAYAINSTID